MCHFTLPSSTARRMGAMKLLLYVPVLLLFFLVMCFVCVLRVLKFDLVAVGCVSSCCELLMLLSSLVRHRYMHR